MKKNHLHPYVFILVLCLSCALHVCAQMDQPVIAYITVQGSKQGNFKGNVNQKGREGQIECIGFTYGIQSPRDASSGLPTGKRMHFPVVIIKHLDGATPQFLQAAYSNETLKSVVIDFYRVAGNGKSDLYQTIRLTNATISKVSQYGGSAAPDKLIPNNNPCEEISFTFQKIQVENNDAKTAASDDWSVN